MIFEVVTLFPEMFSSVMSTSLLGKAVEKGALTVHLTDPRSLTTDKHHSVDDTPYGGGAGMVMRPDPLVAAIEAVEAARGPAHKILLTPTGAPLTQATVLRLATLPRVMLVCGRYEGFDERVREALADDDLSIGDYVLTNGALPAMVIIDAVTRLLPGVLGDDESSRDESFSDGWLEYPQYTRPADFRGMKVPEVLLSGNHAEIARWRAEQARNRTQKQRPDLTDGKRDDAVME